MQISSMVGTSETLRTTGSLKISLLSKEPSNHKATLHNVTRLYRREFNESMKAKRLPSHKIVLTGNRNSSKWLIIFTLASIREEN